MVFRILTLYIHHRSTSVCSLCPLGGLPSRIVPPFTKSGERLKMHLTYHTINFVIKQMSIFSRIVIYSLFDTYIVIQSTLDFPGETVEAR